MGHENLSRTLISIARIGLAHSFFGQLYERVVDVPARLTREPLSTLYDTASPTAYFLPVAPLSRLALLAGVACGWRRSPERVRMAAAVAAVAGETAITVHLVRGVNAHLFVTDRQAATDERPRLLRRWHRLNDLRLVAEGAAWLALSGQPRYGGSPLGLDLDDAGGKGAAA